MKNLFLQLCFRRLQIRLQRPALLPDVFQTAIQLLLFRLLRVPPGLKPALQLLPLRLQTVFRRLQIQRAIHAALIVGHVIFQLCGQAVVRHAFQLAHGHRIVIDSGADAAQQHIQIAIFHRQALSVRLTDQLLRRLPLMKIPGQAEGLAAAFKPHRARIKGGFFPGLVTAVGVAARRPAPLPPHAKQHTSDKCMQRGLSALVFSGNNIQAVGQLYLPVPEPAEILQI